ncbi:sensor domain-containing diguanylate cyclase [Microvirga subterranea]|uniref:diguanylate cyclase n=1 Tax=Microvirga subterranea TaxID=186651 RepID=A0A370HN17_9HYPH|nr:sensor domain-containing diguanylate cyclase [Microvirga subterranea]RDI57909.1 diguanylate cyclase (GGDEF)-like protein [Microvirga subterranea]
MRITGYFRSLSSAAWLKAFVLAVCLTIVAIEGWRDWAERHEEFVRIESEVANLAKSLVQHAEDTFELADAILVDIVDRIEYDGSSPEVITEMDPFLSERIQTLRRFKSLTIYGTDGTLLGSSLPGHRFKVNGRDLAFFRHHSTSGSSGWFFGPLIRDPLGSDWVLTLSRRFNRPDGSFGGVVVASIPHVYFASFFGRFDVGSEGTITLFHADGTLLSRYPYREAAVGRNVSYEPWFKIGVSSGSFEYVSPIDGVKRIGGYQRNHIFPIGVLASVSEDQALADWNQEFVFRSVGILLLVAVIACLGWSLSGQLRRRERAEAELSVLAATDGLTGLANRRTFDKALEAEWNRAARHNTPLSLLLMDLDRFKRFNDHYGHQAGDQCLQTVARILRDTIKRPGDLVARYGGEEIAVLLPATDATGACMVAEDVRSAVEALAIPHNGNHPACVLTISIGMATLKPAFELLDADPKMLVSLADQALYQAKLDGRNRVSIASAA